MWKTISEKVFGASWVPSVLGYLIAGLMAVDELIKTEGSLPTTREGWMQLVMAVSIAVFGRKTKQDNVSNAPKPVQPAVLAPVAELPPAPKA